MIVVCLTKVVNCSNFTIEVKLIVLKNHYPPPAQTPLKWESPMILVLQLNLLLGLRSQKMPQQRVLKLQLNLYIEA